METTGQSLPASQSTEPQPESITWEPGSKLGAALMAGFFLLIALIILGDTIGMIFR